MTVNLAECQTFPIRTWYEQIIAAAGAHVELVQVPDDLVPSDLSLSTATAQHLLTSVRLAQELFHWSPGNPAQRVRESVQWHLRHPQGEWTAQDEADDERALHAG